MTDAKDLDDALRAAHSGWRRFAEESRPAERHRLVRQHVEALRLSVDGHVRFVEVYLSEKSSRDDWRLTVYSNGILAVATGSFESSKAEGSVDVLKRSSLLSLHPAQVERDSEGNVWMSARAEYRTRTVELGSQSIGSDYQAMGHLAGFYPDLLHDLLTTK